MAGDKFRIQDKGDRNRRVADVLQMVVGVDDDGKTVRFLPVTADGLKVKAASGVGLPAYDYFSITRYGATNNVQTITFKQGGIGGTVVAILTFTYVGGGAVDDDDLLAMERTA